MLKSKSMRWAVAGATTLALLVTLLVVGDVKSQKEQNDIQSRGRLNTRSAEKELDDAATPIVDFVAAGEVESNEGDARRLKNGRFDKYGSVRSDPHPKAGESILSAHWQEGLSDVPVDQSEIVVEGKVIDAKAFLSNDRTGVYSEFTVSATRLFKNVSGVPISEGDTVVAERYGGRVRYPSGQTIRYLMDGQGSPEKGKSYLLFLSKGEQGNYKLLTGYGLQDNKVFALDGSRVNRWGRGDWVFDKHNGRDANQFLEEVQRAISYSPSLDEKGVGRP